MKKLIGILVVLVMALSLPVTVLADSDCDCNNAECPLDDINTFDHPDDGASISNTQGGDAANYHIGNTEIDWCTILNGGENPGGDIKEGLLDSLRDQNFDYLMPVGQTGDDSAPSDAAWVSFASNDLRSTDIVRIAQYLPGNSWRIITNVIYQYGTWWFEVDDFGTFSLFIALIQRGVPMEQAAAIATQAQAQSQAQVLAEVSPNTSDSSIGMFAMIAIMLSALGIAAFAIRKATMEMAK